MSDLLMNSIINAISLGHLLLHYLGFSVFLAASCSIVYACCLLVTANYNFHSFWYRLDEELNRIHIFLRFSGRRIHWPLDYAAESQFVSRVAHLKE
jgi:hypothetical protein